MRASAPAMAALLALAGCHAPSGPVTLGAEWNCLSAPPAFDAAGYVFRVGPDGTRSAGLDYTLVAGFGFARPVGGSATRTVSLSARDIAQLMALPADRLVRPEERFTVVQTFAAPEQTDTLDGSPARVAAVLRPSPDLTADAYYLVQSALAATAIRYDFDHPIAPATGSDPASWAEPGTAGNPNPSFVRRYAALQNVCIRPALVFEERMPEAGIGLGERPLFQRFRATPQQGVPLPHNI